MANVTSTPTKQTNVIRGFTAASSLGATQLVAAQPGLSIRVLSMAVVTTLANAVKFQSGTTDISAAMPLGANGGIVLPFNEHGWFQTNAGEALNVNLGTATATGINFQYVVL